MVEPAGQAKVGALRVRQEKMPLKSAARSLEGVFLGMMFEEMAKGLGGSEGSPSKALYEQWFRSAVAEQYASNGGLGLGDEIAGRLGGGEVAWERAELMTAHGRAELMSARGRAELMTARGRAELMTARGRAESTPGSTAATGYRLADHRRPPPVLGQVTSSFGMRTHPLSGKQQMHEGVDIAAPVGTAVRVPYNGEVTAVRRSAALGLNIVVTHRRGYRTVYGHLSKVNKKVGTRVRSGDVVGMTGASGRATGPHLHFGLYKHGQAVNPTQWIRFGSRTNTLNGTKR